MRSYRIEKNSYILKQIQPGTRVLHVGCTNSPTTTRRWDSDMLLHKKICDRAATIGSHIVGIDIDDIAIDFLKEKMPNEEILNLDAHKLSEYFGEDSHFDLIIAGDVIEHLDNPGLFLSSCKDVLADGGSLLITTANAFGIVRYLKSIFSYESVHPEHTAYYSKKTLDRVLKMNGLQFSEFGYYKCEPLSVGFSLNRLLSNLVENTCCLFFPQFSEGVTIIAYSANKSLESLGKI